MIRSVAQAVMRASLGRSGLHPFALLLAVGLVAGCSGLKPYPNTLEPNLQIRTETKAGSVFSGVRAAVGVYRVDARCEIEYQGTVDLDKPVVAVGIPADAASYLVFAFASSSFLGGTRSTISQETLLRPRPGYRYDIEASYKDDIYNVAIREVHSRTGASRAVQLQRLDACRGAAQAARSE
jgi:hypothetical protein